MLQERLNRKMAIEEEKSCTKVWRNDWTEVITNSEEKRLRIKEMCLGRGRQEETARGGC